MRMLALGLASLVLASQSGCAPPSSSWTLPPTPSEEVRSRLGRVVVLSDGDLLAESVLTPAVAGVCGAMGCGVVAGMGVGLTLSTGVWRVFDKGRANPSDVCALPFAVVAVFFVFFAAMAVGVTLGMIGGTIWGLSKTPSSEKIERGQRILEKAVRERRLSDRIKEAVVDRAARETKGAVAAWPPGGPQETILQISGPRVMLHGRSDFDAPLRLYVEVDVRLIGCDGAVLHSFSLGREGSERSFDGWVGQDGINFSDELGHPETYAERIVDEVFVLVDVKTRQPPLPVRGRR